MVQYYIYKITNLVNDKVYIGQHKSYKDMMIGDTYFGSGKAIKKAFNKYGKKNFKREILACTSTRDNANILEEYFIKEARKVYDCYNISDGGEGSLGIKQTEAFKERMSKRMSGKNNPMYGIHLNGNKHSEYTKKLISESQVGKKNHMYGKTLSDETKRKISDSRKGYKHTDYEKDIISKRVSLGRKIAKTAKVIFFNKYADSSLSIKELSEILGVSMTSIKKWKRTLK